MQINNYENPHSSFLSVEKDLSFITEMMMKNERLKKLLYYTTPDALNKDNVTEEETYKILKNYIKIVPKLYIDQEVLNYIIITFDSFVPNATNPYFRDNIINFDVICHYDQWNLGDFKLRPYKIAAEIDTMFNNKHLSGIGTLQFVGCNVAPYTDEFAGITLSYLAVHGDDDKKGFLNKAEEEEYTNVFDHLFNNVES